MKTSQIGIELIKRHEGLKLKSYLCPAGIYTIGYGHTRTAAAGLTISRQLAEELLMQDLQFAEIAVNSSGVIINQTSLMHSYLLHSTLDQLHLKEAPCSKKSN